MSFKRLEIGQMLDSEYQVNMLYVCKMLDKEYLKENFYYSRGDELTMFSVDQYDEVYYGDGSDYPVVYDNEYDKFFICYYVMEQDGYSLFYVVDDGPLTDWANERRLSTWCMRVLGDEESMPEHFI